MPAPRVSYIVSLYNPSVTCPRIKMLPCLLWSLAGQTDQNLEVIVTDNSDNPAVRKKHQALIRDLDDERFQYFSTFNKIKISDCYWSAEWGVKRAKGEWLCFPCDDCYYVPEFQERMLEIADLYGWGLVLCDAVYRYNVKRYTVLHMRAQMSISAKSAFMVRRSFFNGFRTKPQKEPAPCAADAALIGDLVRQGVPHGSAQDVMVVHN